MKVEPPKEPSPQPEVLKKVQKVGTKRKYEKIAEESMDESLLSATADLLNETEVPKVETVKLPPTTFHKSNDIDKRNLPPKERNKRIFRDNNNGTSGNKDEEPVAITSPIQNELMLPHKKKQSSRLLATPPVPVAPVERKKRNESAEKPMEVENTPETELAKLQSPLREEVKDGKTDKSPEVEVRSPEIAEKSQVVLAKAPEVDLKMMEVDMKIPEVVVKTPGIVQTPEIVKTPEVETKTMEVETKTLKVETKTSEVEVKTPEVVTKTPETDVKSLKIVATPEIDSETQEDVAKTKEVVSETPEVVTKTCKEKAQEIPAKSSETTNSVSRRGQKRRNSKDSHQASLEDPEACSEPKKLHKADLDTPRTIVVSCDSEAICINSKGQLSVTRRDSLKMTQANSVMVTSQVIITEATRAPIVTGSPTASSEPTRPEPTSTAVSTPKLQIPATIKIPKNALKFPAEKLVEMKKQGLVTVGHDNKNKLTEKGKQVFKEAQKTEAAVVAVSEPEQIKTSEVAAPEVVETPEAAQNDVEMTEPAKIEDEKEVGEEEPPEVETVEESTNNNDDLPSKDLPDESVVENGKETEGDAGGLIALQAETFGGPANCFYLCREIENRYEPVDSQILVLNGQNALVPYEGEIETLTQTEISTENLTGYPQLSPNSNIVINTPSGQKIELNHYMIAALQEQADENGIASVLLSGEQLELNINGILELISQQQECADGESLSGSMLIDGDNSLILDVSDMPLEIHHSATQVSETLTKPIMSTTIAPEIPAKAIIAETVSRNLNIEDSLASIGVTAQSTRSNMPKSLELPITVTNPTIAGELKTFLNYSLQNLTKGSKVSF